MVKLYGVMRKVEYIHENHGTVHLWRRIDDMPVCEVWRCRLENNVWLPTYQIS